MTEEAQTTTTNATRISSDIAVNLNRPAAFAAAAGTDLFYFVLRSAGTSSGSRSNSRFPHTLEAGSMDRFRHSALFTLCLGYEVVIGTVNNQFQ